jgi:hypothetical protein
MNSMPFSAEYVCLKQDGVTDTSTTSYVHDLDHEAGERRARGVEIWLQS